MTSELAADIIDVFEDFLAMKGIALINAEKDEAIADGETDVANIYGSDHGWLKDEIEALLMEGGVLK